MSRFFYNSNCQPSVPKYRLHRPSGQAVVTISGKDHYLGPWKSRASRVEYDRLIGEWLVQGRPSTSPNRQPGKFTVVELVAAYWRYAKTYYVKNGHRRVAGLEDRPAFPEKILWTNGGGGVWAAGFASDSASHD